MTPEQEEENALARLAAKVAAEVDAGRPADPAVVAGLRAIALTLEEAARRRAAARAEHIAGTLGQVALDLLRFGIFALV